MADGNLYEDQHAGGGPTLTSSGLDLPDGTISVSPEGVEGNALTGSGAISTNDVDGLSVIKATFDKIINWRLRFEPMYQQFATVRPVREAAYPGSKVTLFRTGAKGLKLAKQALSEYQDPEAVPLPGLEDSLDVTVNEYGNATVVTQRLKRFSWTTIDPLQAEYVGRNLQDTVDAIYAEALFDTKGGWLKGGARQASVLANGDVELTASGTMVDDLMFDVRGGGQYGLIKDAAKLGGEKGAGASKLTASVVRRVVAHFRSLGVRPMADGYYVALVSPEVALDLREDSATEGANGWRYPHLDGSWNGSILNGTVGIFEGVRFIESATFKGMEKGEKVKDDITSINAIYPGHSGTATGTHNVIFMGAEGIADVTVETPHTVITPTTDRFGRLAGLGWIGTFGVQVYDPNAILLVDVAPGVDPTP